MTCKDVFVITLLQSLYIYFFKEECLSNTFRNGKLRLACPLYQLY